MSGTKKESDLSKPLAQSAVSTKPTVQEDYNDPVETRRGDPPIPPDIIEEEVHVPATPPDVAFTDPRVTHKAMTWQEELAAVEAQEASGEPMTDAEKSRAVVVKASAAAHQALAKAYAGEK